jgi:hypothetical protein
VLKENVYEQKGPKVLVRILGQAPLGGEFCSLSDCAAEPANMFFTASGREGVGPEKCDEPAAAMIAQLRYVSGIPF